VVIRNAVSDTLTAVYGDRWPWSSVFEASLPAPSWGYKPRVDLINSRRRQPTTGKVIPELKFVFWQKMFTGRYDVRLWEPHHSGAVDWKAAVRAWVRRRGGALVLRADGRLQSWVGLLRARTGMGNGPGILSLTNKIGLGKILRCV
jgi:hypothetical protein